MGRDFRLGRFQVGVRGRGRGRGREFHPDSRDLHGEPFFPAFLVQKVSKSLGNLRTTTSHMSREGNRNYVTPLPQKISQGTSRNEWNDTSVNLPQRLERF